MNPRRPRPEETQANHDRWLITYSDLITLLLAFFIILYSLSQLDSTKYRILADSLGSAFGGSQGGSGEGHTGGVGGEEGVAPKPNQGKLANRPSSQDISKKNLPSTAASTRQSSNLGGQSRNKGGFDPGGTPEDSISAEFADLASRIRKVSMTGILNGRIIIREEGPGLILQLVDSLLFPTGEATLSLKAKRALTLVGRELSPIPNSIRIEGHTDNVPIDTPAYHNNWHLSTARAMTVVGLWDRLRLIPPTRLSGAGYGEHRPIASNLTASGRAKNRRVDIVVIRKSMGEREPVATIATGR